MTENTIVVCKSCENEFIITDTEKEFFRSRNLDLPKRCPECRGKSRAEINKGSIKKTCKECGEDFEISAEERGFFVAKGLNEPIRCAPCRAKRRKRGEDSSK